MQQDQWYVNLFLTELIRLLQVLCAQKIQFQRKQLKVAFERLVSLLNVAVSCKFNI